MSIAKLMIVPAAALAIVGTACEAKEMPYQPVTISELVNGDKSGYVSVTGKPLGCGSVQSQGVLEHHNEDVCTIEDAGNILYLKRSFSDSVTSDFKAAKQAFEDETNDGDNDRVRAFGRYEGNRVLKTEYFFIDDILFPVKK